MKKLLPALIATTGIWCCPTASAQTYTRTDEIVYEDNLSLWVIGQQKSSTNVETGLIESRTDYDPATALPVKTFAFEKLQQTMSYDLTSAVSTGQRGTLKTVSDGRDTTTYNTTITLTDWKRGIPRLITFPDTGGGAKSKSAIVDDLGQILSVTDETGAKTCYGYDPAGRLNRITYPSESQTGVCADYHATSNPNGWNPTTLTFAPATIAKYGLPVGHWQQTVTTGNNVKVTYFDAMWRPLVVETYDSANPTATRTITVTRYDAAGRSAYQSYPVNALTSYATISQGTRTFYDALGRTTEVEQDSELGVLTTTTAYLSGFKTQVTTPNHQGANPAITTTTSYKTYDQPTTAWPVAIAHPEGVFTDIVRDTFGKPTSLTRRNSSHSIKAVRSYTYNTFQELCGTTEPETDATLMGYDAAGNLAWSASGLPVTTPCDVEGDTAAILARKAVRSYDQRNRVLNLTFPGEGLGNTSYTYTADGLPNTVAVNNGGGNVVTTTYGYDKRRLLTSEQLAWGSISWTLGYDYNANGHLSAQTYPDGASVTYNPNALGQATIAGNPGFNAHAWAAAYYPNGAIKSFNYGNGEVHTMTQNVRGLPEHSRNSHSNDTVALLDEYYYYDPNGNVVAITDGRTGRGNRDMSYDGLDRLTNVVSPMYGTVGATYTYDVLDNLTRVTTGGTAARDHYYCYDLAWQLTNVKTGGCSGTSVVGLGYDDQGNLANKNGVLYHFDLGNRLRDVTWNGTTTESYVYDALGHRVGATTPAGTIYSIYSQSGQLMHQLNQRRGKRINYIYLAGSLVNEFEVDTTTGAAANRFQHTDALGTPIVVTNGPHAELERSEYEPYGKVLNHPVIDGPGYTGHVEDAATGLTYMQQRYYDPAIGRFLSVDPVTADGATGANFNRYWYAANNPYRFTDPDGRKEKPLDPAVDKPRTEHPGTETPIVLPDNSVNSDAYNCHSDAWHNGQGDPSDAASFIPEAPRWDNSPLNDVANANRLSPDAPNQAGDVVVYGTDANNNGRLDPGELAAADVHSARVIEVDSDGNTTRVQSKEGQGPVTDHHPSDQNPAYGQFKEWYRP